VPSPRMLQYQSAWPRWCGSTRADKRTNKSVFRLRETMASLIDSDIFVRCGYGVGHRCSFGGVLVYCWHPRLLSTDVCDWASADSQTSGQIFLISGTKLEKS
jgi:hypothetical protein